MTKARNYKRERALAIKRGETGCGSNSGDAKRHRARRKVEKKLGHKLSTNQHVDHKNKVKNGGSNSTSNLRVISAKANLKDGGKSHGGKQKNPRKRVRTKK